MNVPALVDIVLAEPVVSSSVNDLLYLSGNIDFLIGDSLIRVGPFTGALFLLPSLEVLADGVARLRRQETIIELTFVGDAPSLWFTEKKVDGERGVVAAYRAFRTALTSRQALDAACGEAVGRFFETLSSQVSLADVEAPIRKMLSTSVVVWPHLSKFLTERQTLARRER